MARTTSSRRWLARFSAASLSVAVLMVGNGGASSTPSASPREGGSITFGLEAETAGGWCPTSASLAVPGIVVGSAVFDTLVVPNDKGQIVPSLARSLEHDPTDTIWKLVLRDGIRFHDGTPLTADVVKENVDAYRRSTLVGSALEDLATVEVDGPLQLTMTTTRPWIAFPWFLYLDGRLLIVGHKQLADAETCPRNLIGTGPFTFDHWIVNRELVVRRNPEYWRRNAEGPRLPYLDEITFVPVVDGAQRVNALRSGQLDVIHTADGQQVAALEREASRFNLVRDKPGRRMVRYYLTNVSKPPLDNPTARRAIALAIDRDQITQIRNDGIFDVANGPFDTDVPGYVRDPGFPRYDLRTAKKLTNAYKSSHGGTFSVVLEHTNDTAETAEAELIKAQLARAGIDASLQQDDQTSFIRSAALGDFSIMLWRNHPGDDPDVNYQWWSRGSRLNFGRIASPRLQSLLDQGRSETDPVRRRHIYQRVNEEFASRLYNIWAYYYEWVTAARKNVHGLTDPSVPDEAGRPVFWGRQPLIGIHLTE